MAVEVRILCGDQLIKMDCLRWLTALFQPINHCVPEEQSRVFQYLPSYTRIDLEGRREGAMETALAFHHKKKIGSLGFWLSYFASTLVKCENPHDAFYSARCMLEWDPHFEIPSVDYRKSSFQLAVEILPHLDHGGTRFSSNVVYLLELLDFNPTSKEVDQGDLNRLRAVRDRRHRRTIEVDRAHGSHSNCDCASSAPSHTAVWICHEDFTVARYSGDYEQHFGRMERGVDNGLEISVRRSSQTRDHFSNLLQQNRTEDCLCMIGYDVETHIRSVIGLITSHAASGDFLIRSPAESHTWSYLVLRRAFGDIYEIVGHAVLDPHVLVQPYESDEGRSVIEPSSFEGMFPEPALGFDFWFDSEDVLAYVLATKDTRPGATLSPKAFELLDRTFTRSRFSSFATACFDAELQDGGTYCPECAIGYNMCICIHCGGKLSEPASPYFRQDPVER